MAGSCRQVSSLQSDSKLIQTIQAIQSPLCKGIAPVAAWPPELCDKHNASKYDKVTHPNLQGLITSMMQTNPPMACTPTGSQVFRVLQKERKPCHVMAPQQPSPPVPLSANLNDDDRINQQPKTKLTFYIYEHGRRSRFFNSISLVFSPLFLLVHSNRSRHRPCGASLRSTIIPSAARDVQMSTN